MFWQLKAREKHLCEILNNILINFLLLFGFTYSCCLQFLDKSLGGENSEKYIN